MTLEEKMKIDLRRMVQHTTKEKLPVTLADYISSSYYPKETLLRKGELLEGGHNATADEVIKKVLDFFNITMKVISSKSRKRDIVYPRQVCIFLLILRTRLSLREIGDMFGGKDHSTIIHARDTIKDLIDSDDNVRVEIEYLNAQLTA